MNALGLGPHGGAARGSNDGNFLVLATGKTLATRKTPETHGKPAKD